MTNLRIPDLTDDEHDRLDEKVRVIFDLDSVADTQMTALFYAHAYNELRLAVEDLLTLIGVKTPPD